MSMLLIIVPAFFTILAASYFFNNLEKNYYNQQKLKLNDFAGNFLIKLDTESRLVPVFKEAARKLLTAQSSESRKDIVEKEIENFEQSFLAFVFDANGRLEFTNCEDLEACETFGYIWRYSTLSLIEKDSYRNHRYTGIDYLGRYFHPRLLRNSNDVCVPFTNYGKDGVVYHIKSENDASGALIYYLNNLQFSALLSELISKYSTEEASIKLTHSSTFAASENQVGSMHINDGYYVKAAKSKAKVISKDFRVKDSTLAVSLRFHPPDYLLLKLISAIIILLISAFALFKLFRVMIRGFSWWLSIRHKLVVIFIFAVYLPLLGLLLLGMTGLSDRRTVLENNAQKGIQDLLFRIDSEFSKKEEEIQEIFTRFYEGKTWRANLDKDWNEIDLIIRKEIGIPRDGPNFFNHLDVRDPGQNLVYASARGETLNRISNINRVISLICMEKFIPEQLPRKKLKQSDFILKAMMENPVTGFTSLYAQPGKIVQMEFEGSSFYWYWNYYKENNDKAAYFMGNTKTQFNVNNYLEKSLKSRFSIGNTAVQVVAFHPGTRLWIPEDANQEKDLTDLIKFSRVTSTIQTGRIKYLNRNYLATCLPGIKLKNSFIMGLFPEDEIDNQIESLSHQINMGVALIIFIAILTGLLLSKTLLYPVGELDLGLKALRRRDTDFRVQIANQDELGELGKTFNQMMEEVREMLLAGAVQRCLIPSEAPSIKGYESVIYNKMATDVGGDYADFFELPDNRFLIVLGDVTGHGISSSILTAMVKALVFRFAKYNADLVTILNNLSEMIFELMHYRKLMTFCAIILDANDHSFHIANAGHPYPVFCQKSGQSRLLSHSSLPLGVSLKRSKYQANFERFEPGSAILIYTDGIAEAANEKSEEFGFSTVEKIVSENIDLSAQQISDKLLEKFWQHYHQEDLDDDLTYIIIKRELNEPKADAEQSA